MKNNIKEITAEWIHPTFIDNRGFIHEKRAWIKGKFFYLKDKNLDSDSGVKTGYEHIHKMRFLGYCSNKYSFKVYDDIGCFN
jgi:hypothetical protein